MIALIPDRFEIYRVITDWEALHDGFRDRVEDLETTHLSIDAAGKLLPGYTGKVLCDPPMRSLGPKSLPKMLKATGMALVLVIDDERFAAVKEELAKRKRPKQPAIAGMRRPRWLFSKNKAREMGKKRFSLMTDAQLKRHQKRAAKARWRKIKREGIIYLTPHDPTSRDDSVSASPASEAGAPDLLDLSEVLDDMARD